MRKLYITLKQENYDDGENIFGPQIFNMNGVEAAAYNSVIINDTLDFLSYENRLKCLDLAISKLRHGGQITITGTDLQQIAKSYDIRILDTNNLNNLLFNGRQSSSSIDDILNIVTKKGLKVLRKKLYNYQWLVLAERE